MKLKIIEIASHRNGISGAPFHAVLFEDHGSEASRKLAILFEQPGHCAILDVAKLAAGDIAFRSNSWRGDVFEPHLRRRIIKPKATGDDNFHDPNRLQAGRQSMTRSQTNRFDSRECLVQSLCDDAFVAFGQALAHHFPGDNHRFISPLTTLRLLDATKAAIDEWLSANLPTTTTR